MARQINRQRCQHLGKHLATRTYIGGIKRDIHRCNHKSHGDVTSAYCATCPDYNSKDKPRPIPPIPVKLTSIPQKPQPAQVIEPLPDDSSRKQKREWRRRRKSFQSDRSKRMRVADVMATRDRMDRGGGMAGLLWGSSMFLLLGGPSTRSLDLNRLNARGCTVMAVNNAAMLVRPQFFICGDPPRKFHEAIWRDPSIIKFVPRKKLNDNIRTIGDDGKLRETYEQVRYQPSVVPYQRNSNFDPSTWLHEGSFNWGNGRVSAEKNEYPRVLSTMLAALKACYWLGAFRVYLLGCDWQWKIGQNPYAFEQERHSGAYQSNMGSYQKLTHMLALLKPQFDKEQFEIYNCNADSRLGVFPFVSYDDALADVTGEIPDNLNTGGWYGSAKD